MRIVHTDQLSQRIVGVGSGQITALLGDDIAAGIIGVLEGNAVLGDLLHQRRGAVRTEPAVDVGIGAGQLACIRAAFRGSGRNATQLIVAVGYLLSIAVVGQRRHAVVPVVGIGGLVSLRPDVLSEAFQIAQLVVLQPRAVHQASVAVIPHLYLTRAIRQIVVRSRRAAKVGVLHFAGLAVRAVLVGIALGALPVVLYARQTVVSIVGVAHLAAVAVLHFGKQTVAVVLIDVRGKGLAAHLDGGLPSHCIVIKGVGYVRSIAGGIVRHGLDAVVFISVGVFVGLAVAGSGHVGYAFGGVVAVVHCLAGGIRYAGQGAVVGVHDLCNGVSPRVFGRSGEVAVGGVRGFRADVRIGAVRRASGKHPIIQAAAGGGVAIAVVGVVVRHMHRSSGSQQQMLLLFRVASAVIEPVLIVPCGRIAAGLRVSERRRTGRGKTQGLVKLCKFALLMLARWRQ